MGRGRAAVAIAALTLGLAGPTFASHIRPKGATPFRASLVPAYKQCTAANTTHGAPLSFGSCNPPQALGLTTTVGTPDANGAPAKSVGSFELRALAGDARISVSVGDVRCTPSTDAAVCQSGNDADGPDYAGDLQLTTQYRVTDHGGSGQESLTVQDFPADSVLPISCQPTADTTIGSQCQGISTYNALVPGAIVAGRRTIWALSQVTVLNRGSSGHENGFAFLREGVFVP